MAAKYVHAENLKGVETPEECGFVCVRGITDSRSSDGFQGGLFTRNGEFIYAIAGTQGTSPTDLAADAKALVGVLPNQCTSALTNFKQFLAPQSWPELTNANKLMIVSHSLGGGLAQVLGFWLNIRFVTFNALGMLRCIELARYNFCKPQMASRTSNAYNVRKKDGAAPGQNYVVSGDKFGNMRSHLGTVITLPAAQAGVDSHGFKALWAGLAGQRNNTI